MASACLPRAGSQYQHAMPIVHCKHHAARSVSHGCCQRLCATQQHSPEQFKAGRPAVSNA